MDAKITQGFKKQWGKFTTSRSVKGYYGKFLAQKVHKLNVSGDWESISGKYHYVLVLIWY